jgi:hypothetical protein
MTDEITNEDIKVMINRLTHNGPYSVNWHKCMIDAAEMFSALLAEREAKRLSTSYDFENETRPEGYVSLSEIFDGMDKREGQL